MFDVEREQIADGVLILGTIQAMEALGAPGIGVRGGGAIELAFEPADERIVGGFVGTRPPRRRHDAGAQLANDFLPHRRVRADLREIERVERQTASLQAIVVAADAVPLENACCESAPATGVAA